MALKLLLPHATESGPIHQHKKPSLLNEYNLNVLMSLEDDLS